MTARQHKLALLECKAANIDAQLEPINALMDVLRQRQAHLYQQLEQVNKEHNTEATLGWRADGDDLLPILNTTDTFSLLVDDLVLSTMLQRLTLREAVRLSSVSKRFCRRVRTCLQHEPPTSFAARLPPKPRPIKDVRRSTAGCVPHKRLYKHKPGSSWPLSRLLEILLRPSDHKVVWSQRPQEPGDPIVYRGGPLEWYL